MGTWSHDAFGNDTACDWAQELAEASDLSLVEGAIASALATPPDGLDADSACVALVAIEAVARLRGHAGFSNAYTEAVDDWAACTRLVPGDALVQRALQALACIGAPASELCELWEESDDAADWRASLDDLQARLLAEPQPLPAPLDDIGRAVREVTGLSFDIPEGPAPEMAQGPLAGLARQLLYFVILAAEARGDWPRLREGVCRLWPLLDPATDVKLHWDLAVREAKSWAAEGHLDAALAGLAPWRDTAEALGPGTFDMRCMAVVQEAGAVAEAERLRDQLIAAGQGASLQRLDRALREARAGAADVASALLAQQAADFNTPAMQPWVDFARGILAVRAGDPAGLALLTAWVTQHAASCRQGAAAWGFFGLGAGWWALALSQAGRAGEACEVLATVRPLLRGDENALLRASLRAAGLLDDAPLAPPVAASSADEQPGLEARHGAFRTVTVRGVNALQQLQAWRAAFAQGSGVYPFLVGDAEDLARLLEGLDPPADGGVAAAAEARTLDPAAWVKARIGSKRLRWPARAGSPLHSLQTLLDLRGSLKPCVHLALIELQEPWTLFTRLGFGDWNACPSAAVHAALHRRWADQFGAEPAALSADTVECLVARPPAEKALALTLAAEQQAYCPDIVEQGVGSGAALAATLLQAPVWYFWWD